MLTEDQFVAGLRPIPPKRPMPPRRRRFWCEMISHTGVKERVEVYYERPPMAGEYIEYDFLSRTNTVCDGEKPCIGIVSKVLRDETQPF